MNYQQCKNFIIHSGATIRELDEMLVMVAGASIAIDHMSPEEKAARQDEIGKHREAMEAMKKTVFYMTKSLRDVCELMVDREEQYLAD